jgi:ribosomal protein S18 acetylase RimI-like enzyme
MGDTPAIIAAPIRLRRAVPSDLRFLAEIGWYAAHWRPGAEPPPDEDVLRAEDRLGRYLAGWGRPGDGGVVADDERGALIGAAWYRLFSADEPGYGFVSESIPELSIGDRPAFRGAGVGTALLTALVRLAREEGHRALSLSVEPDNRARALYQRAGFRRVGSERGAWTMRLDLA